MTTVYKLTTQDNKTRKGCDNECTWGEGVTHSGTGRGGLCSPGYIHAYLSPALAVLLNPIHADISNPKLWECSVAAIAATDNDLKVGAVSLTTDRQLPLPKVTNEQRVIFAILCAKKAQEAAAHLFEGDKPWQVTYRTKIGEYNSWAEGYLAGKNRAAYAARAAADAAYAAYAAADAARAAYAAYAAADAAADAARAAYAADAARAARAARAADAAYAAADAAADAARAAYAADAARAARAARAADAARAARAARAAYAAADAARAADAVKIDFVAIAEQALNTE